MNIKEFNKLVEMGSLESTPEVAQFLHSSADKALKITSELNNHYHSQEEIREIFSKLTEKVVPESFRLFPPFYTEFGKNTTVKENVFINMCCMFQDQGGIFIDEGAQIGHGVTIVTLNHDHNPNKRANLYPKSVHIGKRAWIGAGAIILPGIIVGDDAIIGAGTVVTKNVPNGEIAVGSKERIL